MAANLIKQQPYKYLSDELNYNIIKTKIQKIYKSFNNLIKSIPRPHEENYYNSSLNPGLELDFSEVFTFTYAHNNNQ